MLAFPTPDEELATIDKVNLKTLKDVLPYSIRRTNHLFVMPRADHDEPDKSR